MSQHVGLYGLQVFVVEDEMMVSLMLEDMLEDFGCTIAGAAATVDDALSRLQSTLDIDAAILDVHVGGDMIFPVADILVKRGVPFVFSTGHGPADLPRRYPDSRLLNKPYSPEQLASVLEDFAHAGH